MYPARTNPFVQLALIGAVCFSLSPQARGAERQVLRGHVPAAVGQARRLGPMSRDTRLNLAIGLPLRNQEALNALLEDLADPDSPNYRHWLTAEQFTERFGPSVDDYSAVAAFAESQGLTVAATHPNRMILDVSGAVSDIESAFHINLVAWTDATRGAFYAPDREPSLDLETPVLDISGLDNYVTPKPMNVRVDAVNSASSYAATGSGPAGLLIGGDYRAAYAPGVKLTGAGQAIGLFELDGFYASDVAANFKTAGLPAVPVQTVLLDGFSGAPGGGNVEVTLDIMMAAYMAPGSKIIVYEGLSWNDILNRMATDNAASQLSCSWGFSPINATTEQIFQQMIAQGQSFFQASGDSGAYHGPVMSPSDDPNVTVVGGTHLATSGPGGQWIGESAWSGSGGGVSKTYPIPSYQQHVNVAAAGGSSTMRNIPDVAMLADVQIFLIEGNGQGVSVGGTSAAAPLWAGFMALANQQAATKGTGPVGFVNPAIYSVGGGSAYAADLHDIVTGSNNGYSAQAGYDLTTGWGTPSGQSLIDQLTGTQNTPSFSLSSSPAALSVVPGATAAASISVIGQSGFSGTVALSVSGLPSGVTGAFSASGTLTLTASASAAPAAATAIVTGKSGSLTSTYSLPVTVTEPSGFTLSASPASLGMAQGSSTKTTITAAAVGGFTGSVTLTVSGLPTGVTASFTRGSAVGSSSLMLTASNTATVGTSTVTVTGTSGTLIKTLPLTLSITGASTFTLAAAPASLSIVQGASASSTVAITPKNGFTGNVVLNVSGLPQGVTGSFASNVLTLAAGPSAATGLVTVTITGSSGTLTSTAPLAVTILAAPSFSLSATPASLNLIQGSTASVTLAIAVSGGFTGKVSLAASGLPAGVTASFAQTSAANTNMLTLSATGTAGLGMANVKVTGTSGSLSAATTIAVSVLGAPDFSISATPSSLNILQGTSGAGIIKASLLNGFSGSIAFAASGLPAGVTASFSAPGSAGVTLITLAVAKTAAKGVSALTITAKSGSLTRSTPLTLTVLAPASGASVVDLSTVYNVAGIAADGVPFPSAGGLDSGGRSYSGTLLGASQTISGVTFAIAPMNTPDVVSSATVPLPGGQFGSLKLLATGVNGSQVSQTFTVNYSDGTKSTFAQSLSDWFSPQNYAGETTAVSFPLRDNSSGTQDGRPFELYEYTFALNSGKTVSSIVLPNNRNVVVLAISLTGGSTSQTIH
jgi:hypothetical protein